MADTSSSESDFSEGTSWGSGIPGSELPSGVWIPGSELPSGVWLSSASGAASVVSPGSHYKKEQEVSETATKSTVNAQKALLYRFYFCVTH